MRALHSPCWVPTPGVNNRTAGFLGHLYMYLFSLMGKETTVVVDLRLWSPGLSAVVRASALLFTNGDGGMETGKGGARTISDGRTVRT